MALRIAQNLRAASLISAMIPFSGRGGTAPAMSSSTEEATGSGTIKYEGKPVIQGQVHFDPSSNARKDAQTRTATIAKDGTYTVSTLVGRNRVRFTGMTSKRNLSFEELGREVQRGSQTLDFDIVPTQPRQGR